MTWEAYKRQFARSARAHGRDGQYIRWCLRYARPIFQQGLPVIYDQKHLALLVGYEVDYLLRVSNQATPFYRRFRIEKRSGGYREIREPLPSLKEIQRWLLDNILYGCSISRFAKGFVPGLSIRDNARFHRDQDMILSLDITDFFGSIRFPRIYSIFRRLGYTKSVTTLLANLCVLDGSLPQGAPTSPALSNLVARRLDNRLSGFALKYDLRYTRYADDITFSGNFHPGQIIKFTKRVLQEEGLTLNADKTRLMEKHQRQEVTGVVVNKKAQAPRNVRRSLRQAVYYIEKYGLGSHLEYHDEMRANYVKHLMGIANFVLFLNKEDRDATHALQVLRPYLDTEE